MATNLHIDEKLLADAVKAAGGKTKRETVNEALAEYVNRREQLRIFEVAGTLEDSDFWNPPSLPRRKPGSRRNGTVK